MPIHERILEAALRIGRERGGWTFRPAEIVAALPDLNVASVRTHVMSRCCANAPSNHPHRWPYFRRVRRGVYEIRREWRKGRAEGREGRRAAVVYGAAREPHGVAPGAGGSPSGSSAGWAVGVAEPVGVPAGRVGPAAHVTPAAGEYGHQPQAARGGGNPQVADGGGPYQRPAAGIDVEVREEAGRYRVEVPGLPRPIQSASLDDTVMRIRDALREGGSDPSAPSGPIHVHVQLDPDRIDPVIAKYMEGFDRTLVIESLKMSYEERLLALQSLLNAAEEIRGAAWKTRKKSEP